MSQVIDLCQDSDDNGEWPNTASVPSLPVSRKRRWDKEESCTDAHPCSENFPGKKTATGSAEFVVDLEIADELEVSVSPHNRKRRGDVKSERSGKNDAAGNSAQILKGVEATEKDVGSEDAQVAGHRESHEGIAAAVSHPMNSDEAPSNASGRQRRVSAWEDRLIELADYRKIHGHCNVPKNYSENRKLATWVSNQRTKYRLYQEGKRSPMTLSRIQALESLGFEWDSRGATWEDRLIELADYRKNPRALRCSLQLQRKHPHQAGNVGQKPKEKLQMVRKRKEVAYDSSPYAGIGKHRFRMEFFLQQGERDTK
jgi:hypothetical protein